MRKGSRELQKLKTIVRQVLRRNLTMPRYQTVGLGEPELQMKSGCSNLLALLISLHETPFCGAM
jgi:hypothetical protein